MKDASPRHVLLIEDAADQRAITATVVTAAGLDVTGVACLSDAEAWLADHTTDVILLDLGLPDAFGLQGVHRIAARSQDTPFLILTANHDPELALATIEIGAEDVLIKGVDEHRLIRAIKFAFKRHQRGHALRSRAHYLKRVFDESPDGLLVLDDHLRVQHANKAACALYGRTPALLVGEQLVAELPDEIQVELRVRQPSGKERRAVATSRSLTVGASSLRLVSLREVPGD